MRASLWPPWWLFWAPFPKADGAEMTGAPSALEILQSLERAGFALTLEARGTAQKWITGKNLFMGLTDPKGLCVRDAYGMVAIEVPLRAGACLVWVGADGEQLASLSQALRATILSGKVRRNSHFYGALSLLAPLAR